MHLCSTLHATGPLLTVDVGDRKVDTADIHDELRGFIGGRGVATKLAHGRIPFDADPLGPENRAYISSGPLQQSDMSFTGRMNMTGVSPLTGGLLSSNAGGYLSRNFAGTGHSVVEVVGKSDNLLAIHITDEGHEAGIGESVTFESEAGHRFEIYYEMDNPSIDGTQRSDIPMRRYSPEYANRVYPQRIDHTHVQDGAPEPPRGSSSRSSIWASMRCSSRRTAPPGDGGTRRRRCRTTSRSIASRRMRRSSTT